MRGLLHTPPSLILRRRRSLVTRVTTSRHDELEEREERERRELRQLQDTSDDTHTTNDT